MTEVFVAAVAYASTGQGEEFAKLIFLTHTEPPKEVMTVLVQWKQRGKYPLGSIWNTKISEDGTLTISPEEKK